VAAQGQTFHAGRSLGAVAGLVAITPDTGNVGMPARFVIGTAAASCGLWGVTDSSAMLKVDDSLDVFGIHA